MKPLAGHHRQTGSVAFTLCKALVVLVACGILFPSVSPAQVRNIKRVLIFNELEPIASPGVDVMDEAVVAELEKLPYQLDIHSEVTDTTLFPDTASRSVLAMWYLHKYHDFKPDVILAVGPTPLRFLINSDKWFFPDVPVVFCGATEEMLSGLKLGPRFTGVWGQVEPAKTLDAALKLLPGTKHVAVVGGAGVYDVYLELIAREKLRRYESRFDFTYLTNLDMPALLERLKHLPAHTIVYYTSIMQDAKGTHFIDATQSVPMVAAAANAPVFTVDNVDVGGGTVGGDVLSYDLQGKIAATIASRILGGEKPQNIPMARSPNVYTFGWRAMRRWGLSESNLPPGSVILNRPPTAWDLYKWYILGGVFIGLLEGLLILGLLWERAGKKRAVLSLRERLTFETLRSELSTKFVNIPEERVSSELQSSLLRIADFLKVDGIALYELSEGESNLTHAFSWSNVRPPATQQTVKASEFPWISGRVMRGEVTLIPDTSTMPDEASAEREHFLSRRVMSAALVPLAAGGEIIGFASFASANRRTEWGENQVQHILQFSEIFSNALRRTRIQSALRESEERFRLMADTAPVLIWMSGTDKLCTYFNRSWLNFTGRKLEEEIGNGWVEGVHPEDLTRCVETYMRAFDRREKYRMEYRMRRHDGQYRWILDIGVPRFNPDGSFQGYIGSAIDITAHKEAQEVLGDASRRLIEAQEKERRYVARELHDNIGQDLALLAVEIQSLNANLPESVTPLRDQALKLSAHVSEISKEVQSISHRLHSSKLELLGVVTAMKGFCRELAEQHGVEIKFVSDEIPRSLPQDISLCLFRVLQEALMNAVKYSGSDHFEIYLQGLPGEIIMSINDSGVGFDMEEVLTKGGLGLISMQERVHLVSGSISIDSRPMRGTHIKVRVPFAAEEYEDQPAQRQTSEHEYGKTSLRNR